MVIINFIDGEHLEINSDTILNGYKNYSVDGKEFYLQNVFMDSIDGEFSSGGSRLATVNPKIGIIGFLLSVDCFSIGPEPEDNVIYFSSTVKSVGNFIDRNIMEPGIHGITLKR